MIWWASPGVTVRLWRELPDVITAQDNFDINRLRLSVGAHTLRGAIVMGDQLFHTRCTS